MTRTSPPQRSGLLTALVLSAFFVSGIAGLVHEVVWIRLLRHVMGNTTFAISMVLTVFMGGLALGSFLAGRLARRLRRPLLAFAILELGIGLYGLALPHLLDAAQPIYRGLYASADGSLVVVTAARFLVSTLLLLIPATLMGTTLPILAHLFEGRDGGRSRMGLNLGTLYAVNTLGAAVGAASAGFLWIPNLGMQSTIYLAALLNGAVAVAGLLLARAVPPREPQAQTRYVPTQDQGGSGIWRLLLLAYAASGFSALTYEVAWSRVLSAQIGSTVYAFSMMLTAFILGLGLGSLVASPWVDRLRRPALALAWVQGAIALACLLVVPMFEWLPVHLTGWIADASTRGFLGLQLTLFGVLLLIMLVPTLLMGACFPLVARLALDGGLGAARSVGTIYSANTVGTILGSATAGFILIPALGTQNTIAVGVAVNGLVATLIFFLSKRLDRESAPPLQVPLGALASAGLGVAVFLLPTWNPSSMSFGPFMVARRNVQNSGGAPNAESNAEILRSTIAAEIQRGGILMHEEGLNTTVTVRQDPFGEISLWVNGKPDASSSTDLPTQAMLAHIPLLMHPNPRSTMTIGLASGITLGSMATHPVELMDCAEISGAVVRASDYFRPFNGDVLDDPRTHIIVEDGRNHLAMTDKRYDVIISEPSNPWIAGVADLFTEEFFTICRERLEEGGVACIWLARYNLDERSFRSVVRTFLEVFPEGQLWNPLDSDYLLVGARGELEVDVQELERRMAQPSVAADLARVGVHSVPDFLSFYLSGPEKAAAFAGDVTVHTDDNALLEFSAPRRMTLYKLEDENALFERIESFRDPRIEFLTGEGAEAQARAGERAIEATGWVLKGKLRFSLLRGLEGMEAARRAMALHPSNPGLPGLFKSGADLAGLLIRAGRGDEAKPLLEALLQLDPDRPLEQLALANLHFASNRMRLAAAGYEACLAIYPQHSEALTRLAFVLGTAPGDALFDPERALELAEQAVAITQRRYPLALRSLGVAHAALGNAPAAVQAIDEALTLMTPAEVQQGLGEHLRAMRGAFKNGGTWRGVR